MSFGTRQVVESSLRSSLLSGLLLSFLCGLVRRLVRSRLVRLEQLVSI